MPLFGKGSGKRPQEDQDFEQEAARQLAETRRQAAERLSGSRMDPGVGGSPPGGPAPGREPLRPPSAPAASFGTPPSAGGAATPDEERRAITDMALDDLQRQRQSPPEQSPFAARPVRVPEEELERRRPPAPGETLPGVPPPHIPSEDLRDQALREILERKERLDREYQERQRAAGRGAPPAPGAPPGAAPAPAPAAPPRRKTRLHKIAEKRKQLQEGQAAESSPEPAAPKGPSLKRAAAKPAPAPEPAPATTTTGESVEDALAGIKGVGPVIRGALMERFDSVDAIREADADELTEVDGIGPALASRIKTSL